MNRDEPQERPKAEDLLQFIDKMQVIFIIYVEKKLDIYLDKKQLLLIESEIR